MAVRGRGHASEGASRNPGGIFTGFVQWIIPFLFRFVSFLLFATCRVEHRGYANFEKLAESKMPFIVTFWHYGVIYIVYQASSLPYVAMVSASKDGEYVSRILESKGFKTVRGSRNKGAIGALKGLIREVRKGRVAVLVADGSQGPARKAQAGTILLASRTGVPVLPIGWGASRYKTFRSWDRTALPLPFSKVVLHYGEAFEVPKGIEDDEIEKYRLKLETALEEIYRKSWGEFGKKEH